ncbi:unnamed protein product [Meloidogyne enterolobii]|uniref:Uncharacterized protein n=1 Tax=Meloidogyne enterolobii TaxID=390850 RepID=A0ACB1AYJ1_MELEN
MPPKIKRTMYFLDSFENFSDSGSFIVSYNSDNEDDDPFICSKEIENDQRLEEVLVKSNKNRCHSKRRYFCTVPFSKIRKDKKEISFEEEDEMFYNRQFSSFDDQQQYQKEFLNYSSFDQNFGFDLNNLTHLHYQHFNPSDQFQSSFDLSLSSTTSCTSLGTSSGLPSPNDYFPVNQHQVILMDTNSAYNYAAINYTNNNSTTFNSLSEASNPQTINSSCGCPVNTIKYEYDNGNIISSSISPATFQVAIPQQMPFQTTNIFQSNNTSLAHQQVTNGNERLKDKEKSLVNTPNNDFSNVNVSLFFQQTGDDFEVADDKDNNDFYVTGQQQQLLCNEGFPLELENNIWDNCEQEQKEEEDSSATNNIVNSNSLVEKNKYEATSPSWTQCCSSILNGENSQKETPQRFLISLEDELVTPQLDLFIN